MKKQLSDLLTRAIEKMVKGGELQGTDLPPLLLEPPKQREFGDLATNIALVLAKNQRKPPRAIAEAILSRLEDPDGILARSEVAGPGFLNFTFSQNFFHRCLRELNLGREPLLDLGHGDRVQVEFASVNPTGPLHVGHGRVAVIGDVLARLLEVVGFDMEREYYVNDIGNQMDQLGLSLYLRYRELFGERIEFPEDGYRGEYVKEMAEKVREKWGEKLLSEEREKTIDMLSRYAGEILLASIREDLGAFAITFDSFFSERELRERGEVGRTMELLRSRGLLYEADGAQWFRSTAYGDDKDRPVIKSDGELTYFASDIAYHRNKFERGFHKLINIWGSDHHGYVSRIKAGLTALDYDPQRLQVILVQMVHLNRGGEPVRMGKRFGEFITLREVLEEVGRDAARFFFLMRRADSHLDFDLDLAKKDSTENPVFYVQYAHARIASIFEQAGRGGISADESTLREAKIERLILKEELEIMKRLGQFVEVIEEAAKELEPHHVVFYLLELAGEFHRYYNRFRVISEDVELTRARLLLVRHVQDVIRKGLDLLGIEAPSKMAARPEPSPAGEF